MSVKPLYSANQSVTISLNSAVDGSLTVSNEIDNSTNLFLDADLEVDMTGGNAAESGTAEIFIFRGNQTGEVDDNGNRQSIGSVVLDGTNAVKKVMQVQSLPKFYKIAVLHTSSGAFALGSSGNSLNFLGLNYQDI